MTDRLEQAKREITKDVGYEISLNNNPFVIASADTMGNRKFPVTEREAQLFDALVAERARNLELRERVRNEALEEAAQLLEEMRKFPVEPCSHDMEGDEGICDGCHFAWEKKQATVAEAIRAKKHSED
jgi:hypothetical protein